jgi:hypothetical protein
MFGETSPKTYQVYGLLEGTCASSVFKHTLRSLAQPFSEAWQSLTLALSFTHSLTNSVTFTRLLSHSLSHSLSTH